MSLGWHIGGGVIDRDDDYRDQRLISHIIEWARNGVVVIGPSRIGKTSLLFRIEDRLGKKSKPIVNVDRNPETTLLKMKKGQTFFLLDEAQILADWGDDDLLRLRKLIDGRPFILAGWPTVLKSQMPWEMRRLLDNARKERLPPFGIEETRRMVRRAQSGEPWDCGEEVIKAIYKATGGFPDLIARFCDYLSEQGKKTPRLPSQRDHERFLKFTTSNEDPFLWIYDSLPLRNREVIDAYRGGQRARLEELHDLGLVTGRPARFSGSFFQSIWRPHGDWKPTMMTQVEQKREISLRADRKPRPALTWLHVSDLHFGGGSFSEKYNRQAVLKALLEDVAMDVEERGLWRPDFIFVTGDIAFKAALDEYRDAAQWLTELAKMAGVPPAAIRLVPGNHDVDRQMTKGPVRALHNEPRNVSQGVVALLDHSLTEEECRSLLEKKLKAYVDFVDTLAPNHPKEPEGIPLDWAESLDPTPERPGRLSLIGLCSVWVCDGGDKERWLFLGERQLRALENVGKEDLVLLLTHHPPEWLHSECETLLLERLAERSHHIHLCGHVHDPNAVALRGMGRSRESFRLIAGAGHGDSDHAYSWGALRWNEVDEYWELGWAPRRFVRGAGWRKDGNRYDLDDEGFAWEPLPKLRWGPPKSRQG